MKNSIFHNYKIRIVIIIILLIWNIISIIIAIHYNSKKTNIIKEHTKSKCVRNCSAGIVSKYVPDSNYIYRVFCR